MRRQLSRADDSPLRRWRRIILSLLGGLLAVQALTLVLFAITTWRATNSQRDAFVTQSVAAASASASGQIAELVRDFEATVNLSTALADNGVVPGGMDDDTERYLLQSLRAHSALSAAYFGFGNGDFLMASRDATQSGFAFRVKRVETTGGTRRVTLRWFNDALAAGPSRRDTTDTFDPRARPWYRAAIARPAVVWTAPYVFFSSRAPGLTVARRATPRNGVARVFGADFTVAKLGEFARQIRVGPRGSTLILADDGSVIAAPGLEQRITNGADGNPVLPKLTAFPAPLPSLAGELTKQREADAVSRTETDASGQRIALAVSQVPVGDGRWTIALYGPSADLAGSAVDSGRREAIKIILLGLAALCLATLLAAALTRPLGGLTSTAASDGLTGLANRRELEAVGRILFDRAKAGGRMLSVGIVDVDHFKQVNDSHGHLVGDDVLRVVASGLASAVRRGDVVGRFAGDEFVIVMPDAGGPEAEAVAARALRAVRESRVQAVVTASGGVATLTNDHTSFEALLDDADRALYRAKAAGRDRVARDAGTERTPPPTPA